MNIPAQQSIKVNLDELESFKAKVVKAYQEITDHLDTSVVDHNNLHRTWSGIAADAQQENFESVHRKLRNQKDELAIIAENTQKAHTNYTEAIAAHIKTWSI